MLSPVDAVWLAVVALYCYGRAISQLGAGRAAVFAAIVPLSFNPLGSVKGRRVVLTPAREILQSVGRTGLAARSTA